MNSSRADDWDDLYGAEVYAEISSGGRLYPALADALLALVGPPGEGTLLDLACGTGVCAERLASRGSGLRLIGVDRAIEMLHVASRRHPNQRCAFVAGRGDRLPLAPGSVAAVTCSAALWHLPQLDQVLLECRRCLQPGGRMAFNVPAAQLDDLDDLSPAPLQIALARTGERCFGGPPEVSGRTLRRDDLRRALEQAGLAVDVERVIDVPVEQREMADLLEVPAIGRRFYPEASEQDHARWVEKVRDLVDPGQEVRLRWWCAGAIKEPIFPG